MKEKLETIRQKCIEAHPNDDRDNAHWVGYSTKDTDKKTPMFDEFPYTLADVLLTLGCHQNKNTSGRTILIDSNSGLFVEEMRDYNKSHQTHWNFLKDSLTDQSEETIDFLYELLK